LKGSKHKLVLLIHVVFSIIVTFEVDKDRFIAMLCADLTTHHLQFLQTEETRDCQRAIDEEDRMENLPGPLSP
jgi:hypothetical protein